MGGANYARKFGQAGYQCNFAAVDVSVPAGNDGRANWKTDGLPCVADTFHFQLFDWSGPYMASADTVDRVCSIEIPAIHGNYDGALVRNVPKDTIAHAQCCYTHTIETALAS